MDNTSLREEFDAVAGMLLDLTKNISDATLNSERPRGWTSGQVLDHTLKSATGISEVIHGPEADTDRDPAMHVSMIRELFLDYSTRMQSPDFILPDNPPHHALQLYNRAAACIPSLRQAIDNLDLSKTCLQFDLPNLGPLTRLEWIHFVICHTRRHLHQVEEILKEQGMTLTAAGGQE